MEHHGAALRKLVENETLVQQLKDDYLSADLNPKQRAMLDYSVKLTSEPAGVTDQDVDNLRKFGYNDREILDICQTASYFNFVNRMADGLGVELEK